jgi:hypothetical protein
MSTPLHQTFASDGYTYLEKYVHSLTPNAYPARGAVSHTIRTSYGNGADATVTENGGTMASNGGDGGGSSLSPAWGGPSGTTNQVVLMRFDLSQIVPGSLNSARLDLTAASPISGTNEYMVYGLQQDTAGWDWNESSVQFDTAPGLLSDSNSQTLGVNNTFTTTSHPDNPNVLTLGQIAVNNVATGGSVSLTNPNLAVFLNLAAYYQGTASENVVTLILQQTSGTSTANFWSKEGDAALAPRLVVDALLEPVAPVLAGDYNDDGIVDVADYVFWRKAMMGGLSLANETVSAGVVDEDDYIEWTANFGALAEEGAGGSDAVPEPQPVAAAAFAGLFAALTRSCRLRLFGSFLQE